MSAVGEPRGRLISLEGISGTGKTYLLRQACDRGGRTLVIGDAGHHVAGDLEGMILDALRRTDDRFLRGGSPEAETLLLLALKADQYHRVVAPALAAGRTVVEDRSVDSTAVYQALILSSLDVVAATTRARVIYQEATTWRPAPQLTYLIDDDFQTALTRATVREAVPYTDDERALLLAAHELYGVYAAEHADRIKVLDRRLLSESELVDTLVEAITEPAHQR